MDLLRHPGLVSLVAALLVSTTPGQAHGQATASQNPAQDKVESDSDPARPVLFSLRPEFYTLGDGIHQRVLVARIDAVAARTQRIIRGAPGILLRVDVPIVGADVGARHQAGLGDAYGQFFVLPYVKGGFAWAIGSGLVVPTATDTLTGGGKWVLAPVAAPMWRRPGSLFFVKFQNFTSIAGDTSRPALNYLLITPTFIHVLGREWWVLVDSETKTKWTDDGRTGVRSGCQLGRRIASGVGLWVKPEVWWGPNRDGEWNLKLGVVWYRRPSSDASR